LDRIFKIASISKFEAALLPEIMQTTRDIVFLSRPASDVSVVSTVAHKCVQGAPLQTFHQYFQSDDHRFYVGMWECTTGSFRVEFTEHEYIHLLAGRVVEDEAGARATLTPGMQLMIPAGFRGVWHVEEPVKKIFVRYEVPGHVATGAPQ
jgi:uncharacterized cupin superfamily protein